MIFNLTEEFKYEYNKYLAEETKAQLSEMTSHIEKAYKETFKSLNLLEDYYKLYAKNEDEILNENVAGHISTLTGEMMKALSVDKEGYAPVQAFKIIETVRDMKFPKNIIFLIKQLIAWLKNVVIYWLNKMKNVVGSMLGFKVEDTGKKIKKLRDFLQKEKLQELQPQGMPNLDKKQEVVVRAYRLDDASNVDRILSENTDVKEIKDRKTTVLSIDITRDLETLKQMMDHFLDIFDNAYGSNFEQLYGIDDLELMFDILKNTTEDIIKGASETYVVHGELTDIAAIDAEKSRENLIRTKYNLDQLRHAFSQTQSKIKDLANIVGHKQTLLAADLAGGYKFYSIATYNVMEQILEVLKGREKQAKQMEKDLSKMVDKYNEVVTLLQKLSIKYNAVSNIQYITIHQRRIANLLNSARYLTQTVTLRMTSLGLYVRELNDIKEVIENLNAMNSRSKSIFDKAKDFFGIR